jgi:hypothetical protein
VHVEEENEPLAPGTAPKLTVPVGVSLVPDAVVSVTVALHAEAVAPMTGDGAQTTLTAEVRWLALTVVVPALEAWPASPL